MSLDSRLRSPKEEPLFIVAIAFSSICWLLVAITIVGIPTALVCLLFLLVGHAIFLAHVKGNGVRVSERQLPELYARCQAAASRLGLAQTPEIYVLQSGGLLNAFATKLLSRKFVIIYSELANQCADPRQLDFVIGHEMGHLAAGHLAWNAFLLPAQLMPWLGPAYSRAREYTCDRCGYEFVGTLEPSLRGLVVLAAGGKLAPAIDLQEFMRQRVDSGRFWMAVRELCMTHPYLCKRAAALQELALPGSTERVGRNPLAYPLAPVLGISVGGASSFAMIMAIYLAFVTATIGSALKNTHAAAHPVSQKTVNAGVYQSE
jgi:Zn-dependent protease with chaperone function